MVEGALADLAEHMADTLIFISCWKIHNFS